MWPTSAVITTSVLALLCVLLAFACRRLVVAADNRSMREWAFGIERDLQGAKNLLRQQLDALAQVGELLDHAGVALERTAHEQESADLKALGSMLRTLRHRAEWFDPESTQSVLRELGHRYHIEPQSGGPYSICNAVRIAEKAIERVLPVHQADNIGDALRTMRKWGFSVVEDIESMRQPEADRLKRAEVVAVELLGPESKGSAAAGRIAQVIVQAAEAVRGQRQFA